MGARKTPGDVADTERVDYLRRYIGAIEWDSGYAIRFGLISIDYATQKRIPKLSYGWYRGLIEAARSR